MRKFTPKSELNQFKRRYMAEVNTPTVSITDSAIEELKQLRLTTDADAKPFLRVGVKGGGCSGLSYVLEYDDRTDFDEVLEVSGIQVIMDKRHALYVAGMTVDYQQGLNDRGFIFVNPNAKESCGCGTSFST
ncbi:iron-sulfur cluster assembly accessory protein [Pontibacter sp. G13]|uniref:HesB/IscA family protein n=1 Tax=Pontibacter sp. G13 TaxID=3074898 RepID=UPI00288A5F69|nr:iron-sulfur cluster assembly accessory protein [Pontibacter sp. G13]WNJ20373.1 iron-sulfur cluster assembly accessory protein [Pontibacter sp. G13]